MVDLSLAIGKLLVVEDFILHNSEDLVRPPAESEGLVRILDDVRLRTQLRQLYVPSQYLIDLTERAQTQLAEATINDFAVGKTEFEADAIRELVTGLAVGHYLLNGLVCFREI